MKLFWLADEVEKIRQEAFREGQNTGYQQGYQTMLKRAEGAFNSYYKMISALVKVQKLDLGPIPELGDPVLEIYLNQVLDKVMGPFALYQPAKERIAGLEKSIAAQEREIKYLENCSREAENKFRQEKNALTEIIEQEKGIAQSQKRQLLERNEQLEKIIGELQNRLDWQGNKSGQQTS